MDIGFLTALIGGALALLSPCGALLLPAFFASTAGSGPRLWAHGALFSVGLLVVLVPLGLGAGVLGTLFASHRDVIIIGASILMIVLGIIQLLGFGFDPSRFVPGAQQLQKQANQRTGWLKTLLLGAVSGVAGLCAGPILGAVLTLAASRNDVWASGTLLAVYGLGMVVPLLIIASVWNKLSPSGKSTLRGKPLPSSAVSSTQPRLSQESLLLVLASYSGQRMVWLRCQSCCQQELQHGCKKAPLC
jgi:cytochrome c biogenesis protein CcdA